MPSCEGILGSTTVLAQAGLHLLLSRGSISPSVARFKTVASGMPYRSQSSTQDISSCIMISVQHTPAFTDMSACTQSFLDHFTAPRAFKACVLRIHGYRDPPKREIRACALSLSIPSPCIDGAFRSTW